MVRGLTVLCSIGGLSCFNLDTVGEHVSDGGLFNTAGSFGTEIEFHKVSEEKINDWRLIISAPSDGAGMVYNCDPQSFQFSSCKVIDFQSCVDSRNKKKIFTQLDESGDGRWRYDESGKMLGLSISSAGNGRDVAVCAPRLTAKKWRKHNGTEAWHDIQGLGECQILTPDLLAKTGDNCFRSPCIDKTFYQKKTPVNMQGGYQFCLAGMSVGWSEGEIESENEIVMGLPTALMYAGNIVAARKVELSADWLSADFESTELEPETWIVQPNQNNENTDQFCMDEGIYNSSTGLRCNRYAGTSLLTADFAPSNQKYIVGGLLSATVKFYTKTPFNTFVLDSEINRFGNQSQSRSSLDDISGFGRSIEKIDFNGDGRLDLVIGAPLWTTKDGLNEGAVYIYLNDGTDNFTAVEPTFNITGVKGSRFGSVLRNVGDINHDGIDDLAVGAFGDDGGRVYIYHGRRSTDDGTLDHVQVLSAADERIKNFGYSITAADIDQNGYSDIAVGALRGGVTIFRSRPIIDLVAQLSSSQQQIKLEKVNSANVLIDFCFGFSERSRTLNDTIQVEYNLKLDEFNQLDPRFSFHEQNKTNTTYTAVIDVKPIEGKSLKCDDDTRITREIFLNSGFYDKLSPVTVNLTWRLLDPAEESGGRSKRSFSSLFPILNSIDQVGKQIEIKVKNKCGGTCQSGLKAIGQFQMAVTGTDGVNEWINIQDAPTKRSARKRSATLNLGEEDLIGFLVEARNTKQDAHQASFTVDYPHTVIYKGYSNINYNGTKCNDISDPDHEDGLKSVKCELGNPFGGNPGASTRLRFKKDDSLRSQNQTSFFLSISTTSEQPVWKPLKRKYTLKIKLNPRIKIEPYTENQQIQFKMVPQEDRITSNTINGKNYDSLEEVIGPKVGHRYTIYHNSSLRIPQIDVEFRWPQTLHNNGRYLLYLHDIVITADDVSNVKCNEDIVNREGYYASNRIPRDAVADTRRAARAEPSGTLSKPYKLTCQNGRAKCVTVKCTIKNLDKGLSKGVQIELIGYAWLPTFSDEFLNRIEPVPRVTIESDVTLTLNPALPNVELTHSKMSASISLTASAESASGGYSMVPLWIIILAAVGGLLILVIIIVILWKMGFFRRGDARYQPEMHRAHRKVQKSKEVAQNDIYSHDKPVMLLGDAD